MKKFLSLLLVVMMLVSMIPATNLIASADEGTWTLVTDVASLAIGDQVIIAAAKANYAISTTQNNNNRAQAAITKSGDTATITSTVQVLEVQAGKKANTFAFYTGKGYLYAASSSKNYLKTETTLSNNSSWNVTIASSGVATLKGAGTNTRNWMRYNSSNNPPLFSCYASGQADICLYKLVIAEEGACEHENTYVEDYVAPTCTEAGATGITYCDDCGEEIKPSQEIPATGHSFVDFVCSVCQTEMELKDEETYVFQTYAAGGQYADNEMHELSDQVVMYTNKAHFTSELRLYSNSTNNANAVIQSILPIKSITVNAGYKTDVLLVYGSNDQGATWTEVAALNIVEDYADHTASLVTNPYSWLKLDVKGSQQIRIKSMTLQFVTTSGDECTHELTETIPGTAATCTTAGKEDSLSCACGQNVQEGAVIEALGHAYDDDYCTRCALINPEAEKKAEAIDGLPQAGDVIIFYHPSDKKAMASKCITSSNGSRMGAVSTTKASGVIPYSATHTAVMTVEQVGDYYRFEMGGLYLTADADGSDMMFAALPAEGAVDYSLWTVAEAESYGVVITSVNAAYNGTKNQAIEYYGNQFYPFGYKAEYISSYRIQIGLVSRIELPPVVEADGVQYTSFEEAYAYDPDATIKLLVDFDEINVTGDLYLDLNGHTIGSVTANWIYAGDSSATVTAAGTGKLTTTSPVETTETIGATRYVALKGEDGAYTFHALELKLSAVTLRTTKAGIYYKAEMACDEVLKAAIASHGVAVSVVKMPTAAFETEENTAATQIAGAPEGVFTSGSITNIFRAGLSDEKNAARGEMKIHANAYLKLADGSIVMGSNASSKSMKDVMEYLNENFASLEADVQVNTLAFYTEWADVLTAWNLENLAAAILPSVPEEEEQA